MQLLHCSFKVSSCEVELQWTTLTADHSWGEIEYICMANAIMEELSWLLRPSKISKHYFMYMFQPVFNEAQLVGANQTDTFEYRQLQAKVYELMPPTLMMDSVYAAIFFLVLFGFLRLAIGFLLPTYFQSLGYRKPMMLYFVMFFILVISWAQYNNINIGKDKRNEIGPYLASLVHHGFVVFLGLRCIFYDFMNIYRLGTFCPFAHGSPRWLH